MKKRKLNSKNPKYIKEIAEDDNAIKTLVQEIKGVKIYTVKYSKQ